MQGSKMRGDDGSRDGNQRAFENQTAERDNRDRRENQRGKKESGEPEKEKFQLSKRTLIIGAIVFAIVLVGALLYWLHACNFVTALKQTYAVLKSIITRDAFVMAFNDAFLVIAIGLLIAAAAIWFCKSPKDEGMAVAH